MPEPTLELKYKSIDELQDSAQSVNELLKKQVSAKTLLNSLEMCFKRATSEETNGNHELAYILYFRCMTLWQRLIELKEFKLDNKYFEHMAKKAVSGSVCRLEYLESVLSSMYEEQHNRNKPKSDDSEMNANFKHVESSEPNASVNDSQELLKYEKREFITCFELNYILTTRKTGEDTTLIIDVRSQSDFENSRMIIEDIINIPIGQLPHGLTPHTILKEHLDSKFKPFFKKRKEYDWVILVDWFSTADAFHAKSPIRVMQNILMIWDIGEPYKRVPVILEAGFEDWLACYPHRTTNSGISPPREPSNNSSVLLDDIQFPDAFDLDIAFVADGLNYVTRKPTIDRSTKPTFQEKKTEFTNNDGSIKQKMVEDEETFLRKVSNGSAEKSPDTRAYARVSNEPSDSDSEGGERYSQRGRRPALANTTSPNIYRGVAQSDGKDIEPDNDASVNRDEDEDSEQESRFDGGTGTTENNANMKRSSSTPNILKLSINEGSRPRVDRSTKPAAYDDQLNMFTTHDIYSSNDIGKGLTGLKNLGNTCYMNSIIQCLSNTELLKKHLLSLEPRKINNQSKTQGHIARVLRNILTQLWNSEGGSVSCKDLKAIVGEHRDSFRGYEQQDSHEFLTILIDWLHEDLKQAPLDIKLDGADENSGEKAWGEFTRKNNSIVRSLFYGQLKSTVCCSVCDKESITFEPFSNLSLPLPTEERCSLTDCLRLYISNENILGWQCPGCKTSRNATKKLDITKLPPLLVIHLKRFTSDGWCRKRLTNVEFPPILDMSNFVTGKEHRFSRYRLYAVSNHYGTMESGHYTAYCWNARNRSWYKFDDQEVTPLSGGIPKSAAAYIVFYQFETN